jgi:hypothetical protein
MRTRRPGSAGPHRDAAHPPSVGARLTFTFISPLGLRVPMTRAHVRLLGPCFKTGPESTQSNSVADRYILFQMSQSEDTACQQLARPGDGARSDHRETLTALAAGPTQLNAALYRAGTAGQPVGRPGVCPDACAETVSHPGLRPTPNGSRRPTGGEVHAGAAGRGTAAECRGREVPASRAAAKPTSLTMNLPVRTFGFLRFTPERFHVLLNSLFKVLFNFPSRYLFAIGLVVIFSLRWSLPPT